MANEILLQEGQVPVDENLRPLKIGNKVSSLEIAQSGNGGRIQGDLEVVGNIFANVGDSILTINEIHSTSLTLDISDTGKALIDIDHANASAGTYTGLEIDFDKSATGSTSDNIMYALKIDADNVQATSGTNTLYGIFCTPTLYHLSDAGTPTVVGGYFKAVSTANGTSKAVGVMIDMGILPDTELGLQIRSSSNNDDYFAISTGLEGVTTLSTVDADTAVAHLTLDADGDINLDAIGANLSGINLKSEGTTFGFFSEHHSGSYFTLYESGGSSVDDYLEIKVEAHGATTISTVDATAAAANLVLEANGILVLNATGAIAAKMPLQISETASAIADEAGYGQIWVKNETPNELYFTTDAGDDIQITDGTSLAGGGGGGSSVLTQVEVTISEAEMDALHTTEKELVAAQGADMVIVPVYCVAFVDRDGSTTQSGTNDFRIGVAGGTTLGTDVWVSVRRFMWNESGDRIFNLASGLYILPEVCSDMVSFDNRPLTAKMSGAITSGSIDSVKLHLTYYVYDNS